VAARAASQSRIVKRSSTEAESYLYRRRVFKRREAVSKTGRSSSRTGAPYCIRQSTPVRPARLATTVISSVGLTGFAT
jgi:hypothetical protein